ncbi:MAG: Tubulin-like protein CetZ [Candidatus Methanogasteraceae archaeon]|nr:MAG: Tubulin-like protein CetZ [ANME-2 cluster archaeon]
MAHLIIGVGQAGCGVLNALAAHSRKWKLTLSDFFAVNSDHVDFQRARKIPKEMWIGISEKEKDAVTIEDAKESLKETGAGFADLVAGGYGNNAEAASDDAKIIAPKLVRTMMDTIGDRKKSINLALVIFGLGGGTGAGFGPYMVKELLRHHEYVIPLVIYPSDAEGKQRHKNAHTSLENLYSSVNTSILFDNNLLTRRKTSLGLADFKGPNWILSECIETMLYIPPALSKDDPNTPVLDYKDFCRILGLGEREEYIGSFGISLYVYRLFEALLRRPTKDLTAISRNHVINSMRRRMMIIDAPPERIGYDIATRERFFKKIRRDAIHNKLRDEIRRFGDGAEDIDIWEGFVPHKLPSIRYATLQSYLFDDFKDEKGIEI